MAVCRKSKSLINIAGHVMYEKEVLSYQKYAGKHIHSLNAMYEASAGYIGW